MNTMSRTVQRSFLTAFLILIALSAPVLAQTPHIASLSFTPTSIDTTGVSKDVTVNLTGTGIYYLATAFQDPSGLYIGHQVEKSFAPTNSPSAVITFPPFSAPGTWRIAYVLVLDSTGFEFLATPEAVSAAFPSLGTLTVTSAVDTTPPNLTAFTFNGSINTTSASDDVIVNFSATDAGDMGGAASGVASVYVGFQSPSGGTNRGTLSTFAPAASKTGTLTITFPKLSEAGTWQISNVIVSDQANNTRVLDAAAIAALNFSTGLTVTSANDTTAPTLTGFSFAPPAITTSGGPVTVSYAVTDDISGANNVSVLFLSPSGTQQQSGSASFTANTSASGTIPLTFPSGTEQGLWSVSFVLLSDAQGNTRTCTGAAVTGCVAFSPTLTVNAPGGDTTPPVIVPSVSPDPNGFGWNTTAPVTVSWSVTDPESTIASTSGCTTGTVSGETAGITFTCSATNSAGLTNSVSVTVRIDLTPPIITPIRTPAPNAAGWNNTDVALSWSVTDPISGFNADSDTGCDAITLTTETTGTTFTCTAANGAGLFSSVSATIKIDKTLPIATATASPAPNAAGWNSTNVTVTFSGTDGLSGIAGCTAPATLSAEGAGQSASGTCTDNAGNVSVTATASGIKIDKTPPVIVPTVTPASNASGWNNSDVTVAWSVTDPISGIASSSGCAPATQSAETTGTTYTCSATNGAGLSNSASVTIKLDKTAPVTSNTTATPNPVQINTGTTITSTITDSGGSNIASAEYNTDGGSFTPISGTFGGATANVTITIPAFTATGIHTFCVQGTDVAGTVGASDCVIVAVFDPSGGFATGGGAIASPAGADLDNPTAAGPATFGFVSKYLPGTTTPSGNLEFQFKDGNLNFKSSAMELLVVTGQPRAQFTGTGTINGTTVCKFDVDAWDGSLQPGNTDGFGLKIRACSNGRDRYTVAPQPLIRGNIVIHQ